ncbi:MAG: YheU family protein [Spongiibacteraceae bacterium]|jgi:uncharacterized protein YheU (UPF0270 family)|nr:YheU family protein [Spongiibacteraceae bacterium]
MHDAGDDAIPAPVVLPLAQLSAEALNGLLEELVTRDGTDYGEQEVPLETRLTQLRASLKRGDVEIIFDPVTETCVLRARR